MRSGACGPEPVSEVRVLFSLFESDGAWVEKSKIIPPKRRKRPQMGKLTMKMRHVVRDMTIRSQEMTK